jgi:hypothetical protein
VPSVRPAGEFDEKKVKHLLDAIYQISDSLILGGKMNGEWLLGDFQIHTYFNDGPLNLKKVVDHYDVNAFDVISITDHILDQHSFEQCLKNETDPMAIEKKISMIIAIPGKV